MIKKIEKPVWSVVAESYYDGKTDSYYYELLDAWFAEKIQPINDALDKAVEVYSNNPDLDWTVPRITESDTHQALLINIQEIKQETCADVLRDYLELYKHTNEDFPDTDISRLYNRAKRALERQGG